MNKKIILLIDIDAFFASVEEIINPKLINKPLIVSGMNSNSVVSTANYEARKYGIKSAMPVYMAKKLCSNLNIIKPHFNIYEEYHRNFINYIKRKISNIIEVASIDECYVDISHLVKTKEMALIISKRIQKGILKDIKLPCTIGISENKFLAKMACKLKKPFGINTIYCDEIEKKLWILPIGKMYLVGKKTSELLKNIGILTIGDLANSDVTRVSKILGKNAKVLIDYANGICENPIQIESSLSKSNSCAFTFLEPTNNIDEIESKIKNLTIRVTKMLSKNIMIKIVYISIKLVNMKNICKRFTFSEYIYKFTDIYSKLIFLYEKNFENVKIKTITIGVSNYKRKIFTYKKNTDEECILKKINNNFKRDILIQGNLI